MSVLKYFQKTLNNNSLCNRNFYWVSTINILFTYLSFSLQSKNFHGKTENYKILELNKQMNLVEKIWVRNVYVAGQNEYRGGPVLNDFCGSS